MTCPSGNLREAPASVGLGLLGVRKEDPSLKGEGIVQ